MFPFPRLKALIFRVNGQDIVKRFWFRIPSTFSINDTVHQITLEGIRGGWIYYKEDQLLPYLPFRDYNLDEKKNYIDYIARSSEVGSLARGLGAPWLYIILSFLAGGGIVGIAMIVAYPHLFPGLVKP